MDIRSVSGASASRPAASQTPEAVVETADRAESDSPSPAITGAKTSGVGGYISPFLRYDQGARVAVLLFRDIDTGETQDQIPSQRVVEEYRRTAGRLSPSTESDGHMATNAGAADAGGAGRDGAASAFGTGGTGTGTAASRGISFASFGASASAGASLGISGTGGSAPGPAASGAVPPPLAGGGGGTASPGGLVSVTV
ncbi:hypothetical protein J2847_005351 [Azospirillum agricola]|uniref:hypothetical protein n=1 Tax=Azospirillum agricola TaxID=1720247 RepID=UPI001AE62366|nr:hypothetical protein [Azospirillum agricola]MBP2232026.1 hypothetical protein [Azospirillum agricola]